MSSNLKTTQVILNGRIHLRPAEKKGSDGNPSHALVLTEAIFEEEA